MTTDPKRRQKALAKKAAKRKEKAKALRSRGHLPVLGSRVIAQAPIYECLVPRELFDNGIGNVIVSRRLPDGEIAAGVFLLDVFCLGVKNAFLRTMTPGEYRALVDSVARNETPRPVEPAAARKLIEGAVAYAKDLGFAPHPDYRQTRLVLEGIDASVWAAEYVYGKDGKPLYISGPNDTAARSRQIVETLQRHHGPDSDPSLSHGHSSRAPRPRRLPFWGGLARLGRAVKGLVSRR